MAELADILRKVQALLTRADHPNTPAPEAQSCRERAELLMTKYRIEETQIAETQTSGGGLIPKWETLRICNADSEFSGHYGMMMSEVMYHVGIRGVFRYEHEPNVTYRVAEVVGYESDLRYAEVLFTAAQVAFQSKLEPKYDPGLSDQVNAYNMRSAGMEGNRIAEAIFGSRLKKDCIKARGLFKKEALARGEDPTDLTGRGNTMKVWRKSYADGFVNEWYYRLANMRSSRAESEVGLVLHSRVEAIEEAFYEKYPQFRPKEDQGKGGRSSPRDGCERCAKAKSGYCREHAYLKPTRQREQRTNYSARSRGADAARQVDLGPGGRQKMDPSGPKGELS